MAVHYDGAPTCHHQRALTFRTTTPATMKAKPNIRGSKAWALNRSSGWGSGPFRGKENTLIWSLCRPHSPSESWRPRSWHARMPCFVLQCDTPHFIKNGLPYFFEIGIYAKPLLA